MKYMKTTKILPKKKKTKKKRKKERKKERHAGNLLGQKGPRLRARVNRSAVEPYQASRQTNRADQEGVMNLGLGTSAGIGE